MDNGSQYMAPWSIIDWHLITSREGRKKMKVGDVWWCCRCSQQNALSWLFALLLSVMVKRQLGFLCRECGLSTLGGAPPVKGNQLRWFWYLTRTRRGLQGWTARRDGRPSSLHTSASKTKSLQTSKSEEVSPWLLIFSLHLVKMQSCNKMSLCISCCSVAMTMKFQHEHLFSHLRIQNNVDEEVRFFFLYLKSVKLKKNY